MINGLLFQNSVYYSNRNSSLKKKKGKKKKKNFDLAERAFVLQYEPKFEVMKIRRMDAERRKDREKEMRKKGREKPTGVEEGEKERG